MIPYLIGLAAWWLLIVLVLWGACKEAALGEAILSAGNPLDNSDEN